MIQVYIDAGNVYAVEADGVPQEFQVIAKPTAEVAAPSEQTDQATGTTEAPDKEATESQEQAGESQEQS